MLLSQDPAAWQRGFDAGRAGAPTKCPYPQPSREARSWSSGRIEGDAARRKEQQPCHDANRQPGPRPSE
jgi:hypothetical protein